MSFNLNLKGTQFNQQMDRAVRHQRSIGLKRENIGKRMEKVLAKATTEILAYQELTLNK